MRDRTNYVGAAIGYDLILNRFFKNPIVCVRVLTCPRAHSALNVMRIIRFIIAHNALINSFSCLRSNLCARTIDNADFLRIFFLFFSPTDSIYNCGLFFRFSFLTSVKRTLGNVCLYVRFFAIYIDNRVSFQNRLSYFRYIYIYDGIIYGMDFLFLSRQPHND